MFALNGVDPIVIKPEVVGDLVPKSVFYMSFKFFKIAGLA